MLGGCWPKGIPGGCGGIPGGTGPRSHGGRPCSKSSNPMPHHSIPFTGNYLRSSDCMPSIEAAMMWLVEAEMPTWRVE